MNDDTEKKLGEEETIETTDKPKKTDGTEGDSSPETMDPVQDAETTPKSDE